MLAANRSNIIICFKLLSEYRGVFAGGRRRVLRGIENAARGPRNPGRGGYDVVTSRAEDVTGWI